MTNPIEMARLNEREKQCVSGHSWPFGSETCYCGRFTNAGGFTAPTMFSIDNTPPQILVDVKGRIVAVFRCKCGDIWQADETCPVCGMTIATLTAAAPALLAALKALVDETDWVTRESSEWDASCAACCAACGVILGALEGDHLDDCPIARARALIAAIEATG